MAFGAQQISPIDLNKNAAIGVNVPFTGPNSVSSNVTTGSAVFTTPTSNQNTPFQPNFFTSDALKNNLINYFLTNPGERPLNPNFGGGLRHYIFEQITTGNLKYLQSKIQKDLDLFFPQVNVKNLKVMGQEDSNSINVSLTYGVTNTNINDTLNMNFT